MTYGFCRVGYFFALSFFAAACVRAESSKELKSDHFILAYTAESDDSVYKIRDDAEYLFRKITEEFAVTRSSLWAWEHRAKIYIAKDRQDYLARFNCPQWSSACVDYYNRVIYTYPMQERFSSVLAHELTHIIFREYIGYNRLPLWLDEGMASFMEQDQYQAASVAVLTRQQIADASYIKFAQINSIYSLSNSTETGAFYTQAFSMVNFLIKRFSRDDFARFLSLLKSGQSLEQALRRAYPVMPDTKSFEDAWKKFYSM